MGNLQLHTILAIIVLQGIVAMGALGNNLLDAPLFEYLDIIPNHAVENELIAQAAQTIATAQLVFAQNTPGNAACVQNPGYCQGHPPAAGIERAETADIKQIFSLTSIKRFNLDIRSPFNSFCRHNAPR